VVPAAVHHHRFLYARIRYHCAGDIDHILLNETPPFDMNIEQHVSLLHYNTFGIDCHADYFTVIEKVEDLYALTGSEVFRNQRRLVLGGGSNLLFTGDFKGLVIKNELTGIDVIDENEEHIWLNIMAGENWHQLVSHCVELGWGGIENLALIPGCVGAAPIQNIGAYGAELKDVFVSLEAFMWDSSDVRVFFREDCRFGYRDSIFKTGLKDSAMILSVTLKLSKMPEVNIDYGAIREVLAEKGIDSIRIRDVFDAVCDIRRSKLPDPEEIGNAGSFFKNPELPREAAEEILRRFPGAPHYIVSDDLIKIPAGWMIEKCGWKGRRMDNIGVHDRQALVLVNFGGGKGGDIRDLAREIAESVRQTFGVELIPEVNIID
jgi:UDP-N-acetylmuramate dehydrogenase